METSIPNFFGPELNLVCLNRTMQYGNSVGSSKSPSKLPEFKSYYVVWKLYSPKNDVGETEEFKSYYVVWKRE